MDTDDNNTGTDPSSSKSASHTSSSSSHSTPLRRQPSLQRSNSSSSSNNGSNRQPSAQAKALENHSRSSRDPDPGFDDFEPWVLEVLGYKGIEQWLEARYQMALRRAKVPVVTAVVWGILAAAGYRDFGGTTGYHENMSLLTHQGSEMWNLGFVWVAILSYYAVKQGAMWGVDNVKAWRVEQKPPQELVDEPVNDEGEFEVRRGRGLGRASVVPGGVRRVHDKSPFEMYIERRSQMFIERRSLEPEQRLKGPTRARTGAYTC